MPATKIISSLTLIGLTWLSPTLARSEVATTNAVGSQPKSGSSGSTGSEIAATNAVVFQLATFKVPLLGREPLTRAHLTCGAKRFTFVVPEGYRVDAADPERVVMVSSNFSCFITLRAAAFPCGDNAPESQACKDRLLETYPGATITEEFALCAGGAMGPAFDLQSKTTKGVKQARRVAFIPCLGGALEFCLSTTPEQFAKSLGKLQTVMLTFRSSEVGGKIDVAQFSDQN